MDGAERDPLSFEEICELVSIGRQNRMFRTRETDAQYAAFRQTCGPSHADSLLHTLFAHRSPTVLEQLADHGVDQDAAQSVDKREDDGLHAGAATRGRGTSVPCARRSCGNVHVAVMRNDFPYSFAADVHHFVLWKFEAGAAWSTVHDEELHWALDRLREVHGLQDYASWETPPAQRSVPGIAHVHIAFRVSATEACRTAPLRL
jgi:hypothetical protein